MWTKNAFELKGIKLDEFEVEDGEFKVLMSFYVKGSKLFTKSDDYFFTKNTTEGDQRFNTIPDIKRKHYFDFFEGKKIWLTVSRAYIGSEIGSRVSISV